MKRSLISLLVLTAFLLVALSSCSKPTEPNQVSKPKFSLSGGTYEGSQLVSITCETPLVTIYYTLDGTNPNSSSAVYSSPISIPETSSLKARAARVGWSDSKISSVSYTITQAPIPANFILVEGGTFNNGTSNVTVSSFYMDKYELTQADYQAVMGTWDPDPDGEGDYGVGSDYPVYYVSWFDAIEYCNRRSMQEGLNPCYSYSSYGANPDSWPSGWNTNSNNHSNVSCNWNATGYRLPTEAEWEFAARGGNQTHNYPYSGSNDINAVAWHYDNSWLNSHTVGTRAANELGLYDMSGNVWEWNWDVYGHDYPSGAQTNPHGDTGGSKHVRRGGGWHNVANGCTVSVRDYGNATSGDYDIGFRVSRVSP